MRSDKFSNIKVNSVLEPQKIIDHQESTKLVLAGNPNVGKSIFFNHLSGLYVDVSNFPGTTVAISKANYKDFSLYDTPGIYGVSSFNEEETVARDIILEGDIILNVVNALHLERDLFLTYQLIEMGKKVSVLLNFCDALEKQKIIIDSAKLSELLGVEVIETSAINKMGFDQIDFAIKNARIGKRSNDILQLIDSVRTLVTSQADAVLLLEGDQFIAEKYDLGITVQNQRDTIYINRRNAVNEIVNSIEREDSKKGKLLNLIGNMALKPSTGLPILAVVLTIMYFFIGDVVSQRVVDFTENTLGVEIFEYNLKSIVAKYTPTTIDVNISNSADEIVDSKSFLFPEGMNANKTLYDDFILFKDQENSSSTFHFDNKIVRLFFGEFGIATMTITYLLFLLLPLVVSFYFVMAILEDSGYLPRLATMLDRMFTAIGLNGKAVIPIILGFGCVTMANITTRMLGSNREKSIVTAILQFTIPCSAQLAVIAVLLSGAGIIPFSIYVVTILSVLISLSTIMNKMLPGESSALLLNLPHMQLPSFANIIKKTIYRSFGFMKEASVWFFVGALGIGLMEISGLLIFWQDVLEPVTTSWLQLPKETSTAFVMGMVRRDFGAAGLFSMDLTIMQITVAIITITLFVPCIASFVVMLKERGWREGMSIWIGTWVVSFLIGGIISQIFI